jgi:acyl carrier protein
MVPSAIHVVARVPAGETAKVDRVRLAELDAQALDAEAAAEPGNGAWPDRLSARLAGVLAAELGRSSIAPSDAFTGDSLQALNAALHIEKVFSVSMDPADLLDEEPLGALVARLAASVRSSRSDLFRR